MTYTEAHPNRILRRRSTTTIRRHQQADHHRKIESIDAHLTIVFAALAVSHWVETRTGWSIKKFVRTTRRYRTVNIRAGDQIITAADPLPNDLREALTKIHRELAH